MSKYIDLANQYIEDVLKGRVDACKWVKLACKRHKKDLKTSSKRDYPYKFDIQKAEKPCKFIELLKHVKGPKAGENIVLEPWECFILCCIFGWVKKSNGFRRFKVAYIEVPRGNGKSLLCSGIALFMLCADGEAGADVYSFATTRDQARIVFNDAQAMARGNKDLRDAFHLQVLNNSMLIIGTNSKFMPKSADASTNDGLNTHCAIVDELHAHKTRDLYDVVYTSIGKRNQPLLFAITTAGFELDGICMEKRRLIIKILLGEIEIDEMFGVIYTIDDTDNWQKDGEKALKKANPNWGVSVEPSTILSLYKEALINPQAENNFLTKHLNVWCNSNQSFFQMVKWRKCYRPDLELADFQNCPCIYGLDLATKTDMVALIRLFWRSEKNSKGEEQIHYYVFPEFFLPEATIHTSRNSQYEGWEKQGLIHATEGEVVNMVDIEQYIIHDTQQYDVLAFAYDPWQATQLAQNLMNEGLPMVEIRMTTYNLSEPMKQVQSLVYQKRLHTDGNPILEWHASNVIAHTDANDNIFPRKEQNANKIDGIVALIMAMNQAIFLNVEENYSGAVSDIDITDLVI